MNEDLAVIQLPQEHDTAVQIRDFGDFGFRYVYARAADTAAAGDPGQDYLAVAVSKERLVFAVCDGVSQSFFGNLAARFVGDALCGWLLERVSAAATAADVQEGLAAYLGSLVQYGSALVNRQPLPPGVSAMLRDVLREKREYGSESTFVAARIDFPGPVYSEGRIILAWMGDTRLRLWTPEGEYSSVLGKSFRASDRWSSKRGIVGDGPHVWTSPLLLKNTSLVRIVAYSDGLSVLDSLPQPTSNADLTRLIQESALLPSSDDVSLVDAWIGKAPAALHEQPCSAPQSVVVERSKRAATLVWQPVPEASKYQVFLRNDRQYARIVEVQSTTCQISHYGPQPRFARVRAWRDNKSGPWSAEVKLDLISDDGESAKLLDSANATETQDVARRGSETSREKYGLNLLMLLYAVVAGAIAGMSIVLALKAIGYA